MPPWLAGHRPHWGAGCVAGVPAGPRRGGLGSECPCGGSERSPLRATGPHGELGPQWLLSGACARGRPAPCPCSCSCPSSLSLARQPRVAGIRGRTLSAVKASCPCTGARTQHTAPGQAEDALGRHLHPSEPCLGLGTGEPGARHPRQPRLGHSGRPVRSPNVAVVGTQEGVGMLCSGIGHGRDRSNRGGVRNDSPCPHLKKLWVPFGAIRG